MKNIVAAVLAGVLSLSLTGCSVFQTLEGQTEDKPNEYSNVYELSSGKAYVWEHDGETDIRNDLSQDRVGDPVFFACPLGDINFKGDELSDIDQYPRSIWIPSDIDDQIPTVTSKNALIYISDTTVPEEIIFERFADYGYSIGVSNMEADGGGHYFITYAETDEDLRQISAELRSKGKLALTAGCAAFSQALIREIGLPYQRENIPRVVPPLLVVCGSLNPITHRQIQYGVRQGAWLCTVKSSSLLAEGASEPQINAVIARMRTGVNILIDTDGSVVGEDPVRTAGLIASGMGQLVRKLMERPESGEYTLMIIGGDTLMAYLEQENASDLQLEGEAAPGVVVFHFFNGGRKIRMLSKSGGFGTETLLTDVITDVEPERARS